MGSEICIRDRGDASHVPVIGYGTTRIKIDGHVVRLHECLHVPALDCDLFSGTRHGSLGNGHALLLADGEMHLSFPSFTHSRPIPESNDLKIDVAALTPNDWALPSQMCEGGDIGDLELSQFADRLDYLNHIFKSWHSRRVMTCAQRRKQVDALKKALGAQTPCDTDLGSNFSENLDSDMLPRGTSDLSPNSVPPGSRSSHSAPVSTDLKSSSGTTHALPDRYTFKGTPDNSLLDVLKELNIDDIKDFLKSNEDLLDHEETDQFIKDERCPPPQYDLESSRGRVKDRVTAFELQSHFGGQKLKDFSLLSQLGTGILVIEPHNDIPTVGELVNRKRGKWRRKGSRATAPLEVIGMDIGYGDGGAVGGAKYVLVLVDQCTTETFVYPMQGSSGGDVCEALWKFFIDAGGFPRTIQCNCDPWLIGGRAAALLRRRHASLRRQAHHPEPLELFIP